MIKEKRGFLVGELLYIILFIVFFGLMLYYVTSYQDGASVWEEIYAKEIAGLINKAEPGTEVYLDVTKISGVAVDNGKDLKDIVTIDNVGNRVSVSLRKGKGASFEFFNDVDVVEQRIELVSGGVETNRLYFKIAERQRDDVS